MSQNACNHTLTLNLWGITVAKGSVNKCIEIPGITRKSATQTFQRKHMYTVKVDGISALSQQTGKYKYWNCCFLLINVSYEAPPIPVYLWRDRLPGFSNISATTCVWLQKKALQMLRKQSRWCHCEVTRFPTASTQSFFYLFKYLCASVCDLVSSKTFTESHKKTEVWKKHCCIQWQ